MASRKIVRGSSAAFPEASGASAAHYKLTEAPIDQTRSIPFGSAGAWAPPPPTRRKNEFFDGAKLVI